MRRARVPVMVTIQVDDEGAVPDSAQVAECIHEALTETFNDGLIDPDEVFAWESVDGVPADEDDPNSPPVPGEVADSMTRAADHPDPLLDAGEDA